MALLNINEEFFLIVSIHYHFEQRLELEQLIMQELGISMTLKGR